MILNKNGFVAQVIGLTRKELPNNLCDSFWLFIGGLIVGLAIALGISCLIGIVLVLLVYFPIIIGYNNFDSIWMGFLSLYGMYVGIGLIMLVLHLVLDENPIRTAVKETFLMCYEYSKAKAGRFCPKINWE